ncbi:MFS transporter, partial [Streptomyces sp. SID8455]|nr:MFS transporter [Streptomyces sp. SID8455]
WTSTGLAVGVALGSSAAGWVVDAAGAKAGYAVPAVAGALAAAVAFLGYRRLAKPVPTGGRGEDDRHLRTDDDERVA